MSAQDWSAGNVLLLRQFWADGLSATDIVRKFAKPPLCTKFTRSAVIGKVHRLGLERRRPSRPAVSKRSIRDMAAVAVRASAPKIERAPWAARELPVRGPNSVRFINRKPNQCAMFCEGEEGALGFVCAAEVSVKAWCASCEKLVYRPPNAAEKAQERMRRVA